MRGDEHGTNAASSSEHSNDESGSDAVHASGALRDVDAAGGETVSVVSGVPAGISATENDRRSWPAA